MPKTTIEVTHSILDLIHNNAFEKDFHKDEAFKKTIHQIVTRAMLGAYNAGFTDGKNYQIVDFLQAEKDRREG